MQELAQCADAYLNLIAPISAAIKSPLAIAAVFQLVAVGRSRCWPLI
jgi:hypothetical protein